LKDIVHERMNGHARHTGLRVLQSGYRRAEGRRSSLSLGHATQRGFALLLLFSALAFSNQFIRAAQREAASKPVIIAYLFPRNSVIQADQIAAGKLSRINFAFANIQDGRMVEGDASDAANYAVLNAIKLDHPSLKVLVSVGGWLWSVNFSDVALTSDSRKKFIQSVVEFVERYKLDGLDIDWEYPGLVGAGNHFRPEDKQNYTLLLQEIRKRFDQEQKRLGRRLFLSIATGASTEFLEHTEMAKVQLFVDTVNLMAYDYYEPGSEKTTGNHAPLFTDPADPKKISADDSIRQYELAGVPANKIVLGVPFYGHVWGEVPPQNHGLFQPGKPVPNSFSKYRDITATMLPQGFTRYWDAAAAVPYLYSEEKRIFISYEDPESLAAKCKYVLDHKLAGVMFWDYSSDSDGSLLNALNSSLYPGPGTAKNAK
jgi:chitinase